MEDIILRYDDLISLGMFDFTDNSIEFMYYIYNRKSVSYILYKNETHRNRIIEILEKISNGKYLRSMYSTMLESISEITRDESLGVDYIVKYIINDYMSDRIHASLYCRDVNNSLNANRNQIDFDTANMYEYYNHIYEFNLPIINHDRICGI